MKESHNYDHSHGHESISTNSIKLTFILNTIFTIIEFFAGMLTNSITISSNAIHDLGDSIILLFSWLLEIKSKRPRNDKYTYGYRRFSLAGGLINAGVLFFGAFIILYGGINRLIHPEEINGLLMFYFAIIGVIFNGIGVYKLFRDRNSNSRSLYLNILGDVIGWISILFSSIMVLVFNITYLDSIISICMAIWLFTHSILEMIKIFTTLMQTAPKDVDLTNISTKIIEVNGIIDVHDFHVWDLDHDDYIATLHIVIDEDIKELEQIMNLKENLKILLEKYKINHATIEVDTINQAIKNGEIEEKL